MRLDIYGKPYLGDAATFKQTIVATYNPQKQRTTINCDVDIVTLGITAEVLMQQYNEALYELSEEAAHKIRTTIRRAINNEED